MKNEDKDFILLSKADFDQIRGYAHDSDFKDEDRFDALLNRIADMNPHFEKELNQELEEDQKYYEELSQKIQAEKAKVKEFYEQHPVGSSVFVKHHPFNYVGRVVDPPALTEDDEYIYIKNPNGNTDYVTPDYIIDPVENDNACPYRLPEMFAKCIAPGYRENIAKYLQSEAGAFFHHDLQGLPVSEKTIFIAECKVRDIWKGLYAKGYVLTASPPEFKFYDSPPFERNQQNHTGMLVFYWLDEGGNPVPYTL